jgi:hypothetical protein
LLMNLRLGPAYQFSAEFQPVAGLLIHSPMFRSTLRLLIRCDFYIRAGVAPMLRSILIVSMDQYLLNSRVLVLKSRGFDAVGATSIDGALKLAKSERPSLGIICHTLSGSEQSMFVDALIRICPKILFMRLREGEVNPDRLVADCELFFAPHDEAMHKQANSCDGFSPSRGRRTRAHGTSVQ